MSSVVCIYFSFTGFSFSLRFEYSFFLSFFVLLLLLVLFLFCFWKALERRSKWTYLLLILLHFNPKESWPFSSKENQGLFSKWIFKCNILIFMVFICVPYLLLFTLLNIFPLSRLHINFGEFLSLASPKFPEVLFANDASFDVTLNKEANMFLS